MNTRCDDCAFTPGTEANKYKWTVIKAKGIIYMSTVAFRSVLSYN